MRMLLNVTDPNDDEGKLTLAVIDIDFKAIDLGSIEIDDFGVSWFNIDSSTPYKTLAYIPIDVNGYVNEASVNAPIAVRCVHDPVDVAIGQIIADLVDATNSIGAHWAHF